jgi:hypothetical protein
LTGSAIGPGRSNHGSEWSRLTPWPFSRKNESFRQGVSAPTLRSSPGAAS